MRIFFALIIETYQIENISTLEIKPCGLGSRIRYMEAKSKVF